MLDTLYDTENTVDKFSKSKIEVHSVKLSHENSEEPFQNLEVVPSVEAADTPDGANNKDIRPRLTDGFNNQYLCDSGSQSCVWPAQAGDQVDPTIRLQTVDGSPFDCYGKKELTIKINRKTYQIQAVVAKVKSPILGWDFFKKYRLDMIWGEFGDVYLRDKKS